MFGMFQSGPNTISKIMRSSPPPPLLFAKKKFGVLFLVIEHFR